MELGTTELDTKSTTELDTEIVTELTESLKYHQEQRINEKL